jgi:hypothetical protein
MPPLQWHKYKQRGWTPPSPDWQVNFNDSEFDSGSIASFINSAAPVNTFGRQYGTSLGYIADEAAANTFRQHYSLANGSIGTRLGLPVAQGGSAMILNRTGCGLLGEWTNTNTTDTLETSDVGPRNTSSLFYRLVETTANALHYANASMEAGISSAGYMGFNCWLKQGTRRYALVYFPTGSNNISADTGIGIDLQTGTVTDTFGNTGALQYRVVQGQNGWLFVYLACQTDQGNSSTVRQIRIGMSTAGTYATRSYTGSTSNYIFVADHTGGAVHSFGNNPLAKVSPEPGMEYTTGTADATSSSFEEAVEFTRTINNGIANTFYCEMIPLYGTVAANNPYTAGVPGSVPYGFYARSGTGNPADDSFRWGPGELVTRASSVDNTTVTNVTALSAIAFPVGQIVRMALALNSNDGEVVVNGTQYITKGSFSIPPNLTVIGFGFQPNSARYLRAGILRSIKHWENERFTTAQLIQLTTAPP